MTVQLGETAELSDVVHGSVPVGKTSPRKVPQLSVVVLVIVVVADSVEAGTPRGAPTAATSSIVSTGVAVCRGLIEATSRGFSASDRAKWRKRKTRMLEVLTMRIGSYRKQAGLAGMSRS